MKPRLRKLVLTAHVTFSVGWLGAVAAFLALSIAGLTSQREQTVRGAYLAMDLVGSSVIVPMSLAAVVTGLVQALGTEWGLFRHYWVLVKFILSLGATFLLLVHQFKAVAGAASRVAAATAGTLPSAGPVGAKLVGDAALALLVLVVATALSVYKPWGRTRHGRRKLEEQRDAVTSAPPTRGDVVHEGWTWGARIALALVGAAVAAVVALHLTGHGLRHGSS
jgi:hypothetical protein